MRRGETRGKRGVWLRPRGEVYGLRTAELLCIREIQRGRGYVLLMGEQYEYARGKLERAMWRYNQMVPNNERLRWNTAWNKKIGTRVAYIDDECVFPFIEMRQTTFEQMMFAFELIRSKMKIIEENSRRIGYKKKLQTLKSYGRKLPCATLTIIRIRYEIPNQAYLISNRGHCRMISVIS